MKSPFDEKNSDNINEDYGFEVGLQLQNNPFEFCQSNEKEEMKETVLDNIIRQSSIIKVNEINNNINNNNNNNNFENTSIISPNEMGEILKNLKKSNLISNEKFMDLSHENEYLKVRELRKVKNETFNTYLQSINYQEIQNLTNYILNKIHFNINENNNSNSIDPCVGIFRLVEASFGFNNHKINEMKQKLNLLSDYNFYRRVKGDGNCFYRAIIFKYLEIIIFNNNIELMKDLIFDVEECFEDKIIKNKLNIGTTDFIKPSLVKNILTSIFFSMRENDLLKAYKLLYISINTCKKFDMGLILYFRYVLYKYINENKNKLYTKDFGVKIGNLLPGEYEIDDGKFLFDEFYENYLLKLFNDAEKIIIYLTPFVFPIKLNIILYDGKQKDIFQEFYSPGNKNNNYIITLLNKKVHYEIIYSNIEFNNFGNILQSFINNQIKPRCLPINYINYNLNNNNFNNNNNYQDLLHLNDNIQKKNNQQGQYNQTNFQKILNNNNNCNNAFISSNPSAQTFNNNIQINSQNQDINSFFIEEKENETEVNNTNQMNYNQNNNQMNYNQNNNQMNYNQNNNQMNNNPK